jgi:hypothetical protein
VKYSCFERTNGGIRPKDFLTRGAKQYLDNCEREIFDVWQERSTNTSDVGLAGSLNATVKPRFEKREVRVEDAISDDYSVFWFLQHRNSTEKLILRLFKTAKETSVNDALVIVQTKDFRTKFHYDSSAITFDSFCDDLDEFVDLFRPNIALRIFFLVLEDLDFFASPSRKSEGKLKLSFRGST